MLQKLRTRHPIDLPAEKWGRRGPTLAILGGIFLLAVLLPLILAFVGGLLTAPVALGVGLAVLFVVLLVGGARGKPGWNR